MFRKSKRGTEGPGCLGVAPRLVGNKGRIVKSFVRHHEVYETVEWFEGPLAGTSDTYRQVEVRRTMEF